MVLAQAVGERRGTGTLTLSQAVVRFDSVFFCGRLCFSGA